jgi:hypothetical protein
VALPDNFREEVPELPLPKKLDNDFFPLDATEVARESVAPPSRGEASEEALAPSPPKRLLPDVVLLSRLAI